MKQEEIVMAKIRECEYKKYAININNKNLTLFQKSNTKTGEEEIIELEMREMT